MLVVERKRSQSIVIDLNGARVEVALLSIGGSRVKIGVQADRDVIVLRKELLDRQEAA